MRRREIVTEPLLSVRLKRSTTMFVLALQRDTILYNVKFFEGEEHYAQAGRKSDCSENSDRAGDD